MKERIGLFFKGVAVIAIEPDKNTKKGVSGVEAGERNEISPATIIPKTRKTKFLFESFST